jgi:putative phosphoribosyl transferase
MVFEFADRRDAGRRLAAKMRGRGETDVVVLGLPRGGVPVAAEVADALGAPLDVLVVRKLGLPFEPEVAMGAIGEGGVRTLDRVLMARAGVTAVQLDEIESQERETLEERSRRLRDIRRRVDLTGRTAIIVDDGIATGSTAMAACRVARVLGAARVVVAAPVGSPTAVSRLTDADDVVCVLEPADFTAVGRHYLDFSPTSDAEVEAVLSGAESA